MIRAYVESNFILEVVRKQEQHLSASSLFELADRAQIHLCIPEFCLAEPFAALDRYRNQRHQFRSDFEKLMQDLRRTEDQRSTVDRHADLVSSLLRLSSDEQERLADVVRTVLRLASVLPLSASAFEMAMKLRARGLMRSQDAVVFAVTEEDLEKARPDDAVFITRNARDFEDPTLREMLRKFNCRIIGGYQDALRYLSSRTST